jgi:glyoxylase-like metal-dependent hydrolase (beta-lactamase superfamily II)
MIRLDELATVVLAPNPSPMTLEGTNTYVLGAPDADEVIVVDPGPDLLEHRRRLDGLIGERDVGVAAVVLTHHHADHAEAAAWSEDWGAPLHAFTPALVPAAAEPLRDGDLLQRAGLTLEVVHTPGHASDHVCLRVVETDAVLTGDHVLGRGTTVVFWPDGDMGDYVASLRRVMELGATSLYPGHGPAIDAPATVLEEYLTHRLEREQQVLDALRAGDRAPSEIVARVYVDVDPVLHPAAERSVRAHLAKLVADGVVADAGEQARFHLAEETT